MYHQYGAVTQKNNSQEMCQIFEYPTNSFKKMTEQEKQLLTDNDIPKNVVLDAIYILEKFENTGCRVPTPGGVSAALALRDITEEVSKRKEHAYKNKPLTLSFPNLYCW